jgi:hypothetical protein
MGSHCAFRRIGSSAPRSIRVSSQLLFWRRVFLRVESQNERRELDAENSSPLQKCPDPCAPSSDRHRSISSETLNTPLRVDHLTAEFAQIWVSTR